VDSARGYAVGNVVPCCRRCNTAKLDSTVKEFKLWIKKPTTTFMEVQKTKNSFNEYRLTCSYGELEAIRAALERNHMGPVADELYQGVIWHMDRLPGPGEEEQKEGGEGGEGTPPGNFDLRSAANDLRTPDELAGYEGEGGEDEGAVRSQVDLDRELPGPPEED